MSDPRLNSIHLDPERREEFRRARQTLLRARGEQTVVAENQDREGAFADADTLRRLRARIPHGQAYVLLDGDVVYPLRVGLNTIGRLRDNDVVVNDPYVSRRHCAVLVHAGNGCELHDVASKNGTFLNGRQVRGPAPLATGDEVRMCDRQLIFASKEDRDGVTRVPPRGPRRGDATEPG